MYDVVRVGKEGLVGEIGVTRTPLSPEGKVFVHGELWDAVADQDIPSGTRVKVIEVFQNLRIRVAPHDS